MRIGLNLLYLIPGIVGGTETYAAGLLNALAKVGNNYEFVVFVNKESAKWPIPHSSNFIRVICPVAAINRSQRYFYEQFRLPGMLKRHQADVVHSLGYVGPLRTFCPSIVTVHDLNYRVIGHNMSLVRRYLLRFFTYPAARRAKAIITVSNYSKSAICNRLKIHPEKIVVTLLGPRWNNCIISEDSIDNIKTNYNISSPYLVAFGGGSAHKNITRLLKAFAAIKKELEHKLVLIGHVPNDIDLGELSGDIVTTGYVPAEHVLPLLRGADLFVLPSLYEGFGLPVLEAQQESVPVVCSMAASLPEIAGEGAVFFNPYSIVDIANKITLVLKSQKMKEDLREKGLANVRRFSWERTAKETLAVYEKVVNS